MRSCLAGEQCWSWLKALQRWGQLLVCATTANFSTAKYSAITFINLSERSEGMLKLFSPYYTMINLFNCSCLQLISIHSAYTVNLMHMSLCWFVYTKQQKAKQRVFSFLWTLWTLFDLIEVYRYISVLLPSFHCRWPKAYFIWIIWYFENVFSGKQLLATVCEDSDGVLNRDSCHNFWVCVVIRASLPQLFSTRRPGQKH